MMEHVLFIFHNIFNVHSFHIWFLFYQDLDQDFLTVTNNLNIWQAKIVFVFNIYNSCVRLLIMTKFQLSKVFQYIT